MRNRLLNRCVCPLFAVLLCVPTLLSGCAFSLSPPDPTELMSFVYESFLCGFTVADTAAIKDGGTVHAALSRDDSGDTLTVMGTHANVVYRFSEDDSVLSISGSDTEAALEIPVTLPLDRGAARWRSVFCIVPDETFSAEQTENGILVTRSGEGEAFSALFSQDGIPQSLTLGDTTLYIASFSQQTTPLSESE